MIMRAGMGNAAAVFIPRSMGRRAVIGNAAVGESW